MTMALSRQDQSLAALLAGTNLDPTIRQRIVDRAVRLVEQIRAQDDPGMMELFLGEYGLSSEEGIALMCLAEALLRVPDADTMDALIEDKIAPSEWGRHLGRSHSSLVNASTWALYLTGKVLKDDDQDSMAGLLHGAIKRLGEPVIRQAVTRVMKEMGQQFVLGETISSAINRARTMEQRGYTYSYDMLGEAALTERDAKRYHLAYGDAIADLGKIASSDDIRLNPGISIKLSALHPRYETLQRERVLEELVPRARSLAVIAQSAGIGLNVDAEEAGRLGLSLEVIEAILASPAFRNWDGFGIVVQAYNLRALQVIEQVYDLASRLDRRIMVRLVKGAYWDTEIKHAQVEGHDDFPVYTRKPATDVSYICCAERLLSMVDRIYPQFATHNAHTVSAILEMAEAAKVDVSQFEFQRLHGMGEALHDVVLRKEGTRCRIYAPVGAHRDLLAYLVRRLLENGANSSFVNQIVDHDVSPQEIAADPFVIVERGMRGVDGLPIDLPADIFQPQRINSRGYDLEDPATLLKLESGIARFDLKNWSAETSNGDEREVLNPATGARVGTIRFATPEDVNVALEDIEDWSHTPPEKRADILRAAADLYEDNAFEVFSLLMREAGKALRDCVAELREAVDFLRYYAAEAEKRTDRPAGIFACIAPWNFPLAIYSGQIAAALATGNGVIAKPAEATSLIAEFATNLLWQAGVPKTVLKFMPGEGSVVGAVLSSSSAIDGICFTGSTQTAMAINRSMARHLSPTAPLIAETGGLNAMIVDSTALPEQAIRDVVASAFQSAGQRCSALRVLYLQKDIAEPFLRMLYGAIDELRVGDPRMFATDIGPIIDAKAASKIREHIDFARQEGRVLKEGNAPDSATFVPPTVLSISGIADLEQEIFGPVLHVATYRSEDLDEVIAAVNATGYGLTFGFHSRIDDRVQTITEKVRAGNIYINRNQIGAVVGSQPFGGEGMSGTGPKAGGPLYLDRFNQVRPRRSTGPSGTEISPEIIEQVFSKMPIRKQAMKEFRELPGPTGESNRYGTLPRGRVLCLGPGGPAADEQMERATAFGCQALAVAAGSVKGIDGIVSPENLSRIGGLDAVICWQEDLHSIRKALADRDGPIVRLIAGDDLEKQLVVERHICIDTTAAGGNAALLAG